MLQARRNFDLSEKPFAPQRRCEFRAQDFERYLAPVFEVVSELDDSHPSATDFSSKRITIS